MKKINLILIGIIFGGIALSYAQNVNVDLTVKFNGDYKLTLFTLFFTPLPELKLGSNIQLLIKRLLFTV